MPETLTAPDPSVHQHGLETGPAASVDMSGAPTQIRGLDVGGLREVPEDGKVLQDFGEMGEEAGPAQEGLGMIALSGSEVEVPPLAIERGFDEPEASESLAPPAPVPPIQTPEHPEIMQSVFELARNVDVPLGRRIEALKTYVQNQEAKEDTRPGETLDEYLARLDRVTAGEEHLWSPELKYAKETLHSLELMRGPERETDSQSASQTTEVAQPNPVSETIDDQAEPEPELPSSKAASSQTIPSNQTTQKPTNSSTQTNASNTGTNSNTSTNTNNTNTSNNTNSNSSNTTQQQTQTTPTPTPPSPSPKPNQKSQQPANPTVQAAQAAAAAQAGQGGFGGAEAAAVQSTAHRETGATPISTADMGPGQEAGEEKGFVDTLSLEDQTIWENIVRINDQFKDGEVSEALTSLEKNFNEENAAIVMSRAQKSAQARQGRGDVFGARQQQMLAANLAQLTGHVLGKDIFSRVA